MFLDLFHLEGNTEKYRKTENKQNILIVEHKQRTIIRTGIRAKRLNENKKNIETSSVRKAG